MAKEQTIHQPVAAALKRSLDHPSEFTLVYEFAVDKVLNQLLRQTFDADVAAELTAETFARALEKRKQFKGTHDAEVMAWLNSIARRLHLNYIRRGQVAQRSLKRLKIELPELSDIEREEVEQSIDFAHMRDALREALSGLPTTSQAALKLRVIDEMPYVDVAFQLGISEQAARAQVSRAIRSVRKSLVQIEEAGA